MTTFVTELSNAKWTGGFGSGGTINPSKWATELYAGEMPGPWLCCYMLRRFGWPNEGSDDYKNLMSWTLSTPMPGLYLSVTPYLGHNGEQPKDLKHAMNLHFGIRFNDDVESKLNADPLRDAFFKRRFAVILKWWQTNGCKLYTFGATKRDDPEETLVHEYGKGSKKPEMLWGLWKHRPEHDKAKINHKNGGWLKDDMALWWFGNFLKKHHPEVRLPKMRKREREMRMSRFDIQVRTAVRATLKDLLRPTNVRDISFTPFGDIERTPEAVKRYTNQKSVPFFHGAGYTPEYWFKHATAKERRLSPNS